MQNDDLEFINSQNVLHCIERDLDKPSRAAIAKHVGLSRTAISLIAQRLINYGLVKELETTKQGRGRPGTPLVLNDTYWYTIGAAFYAGKWIFVAINLLGDIALEHTITVTTTTPEKVVSELLNGLEYMQQNCPGHMLPAFGIGAPGLVDNKTGDIFRADDLGWRKIIPIGAIIKERTGIAAYVINRYRANGLAEVRYGNCRKSSNLVYIGIGTGIAGSIYLNKELMNSTKYRLGHMVIDPNGPVCGCGQRGCLQAMASELALIRFAQEHIDQDPGFLSDRGDSPLNGLPTTKLAQEGHKDAKICLEHIARPISIAICTLVNAIAPDEIIIGGPLGDSSDYLVDYVRALVKEHLLDWQFNEISIERGTRGYFGSAVGAASFALDHKLELIMDALQDGADH
jgi:predicted NBD/HSP70 family sugar kinase